MPDKPADQLAKLKDDLAANQSKSADLGKEADRIKAQISDLSKAVTDIDAKATAFDKALKDVTQRQKELDNYIKTKKQMLEAALPNKADVVKAKQDAQQKLADLAKKVRDLTNAAIAKEKAWNDAKADNAKKQTAYTSAANLGTENDATLKDLTSLQAAADKEGTGNQLSKMYFHVLLMEEVLKKLNLPSSADYQKTLNQAANDAAAAAVAERTAKEAMDQANADRQQAQKDLDDARAKWRQQTADSLADPKPAAAPAVAAPGASGTAGGPAVADPTTAPPY
jgi:chromosome segregation ATPase